MDLGKAVRELRKEKGVRLKDFAEKIDMSTTAVANIEKSASFPTKRTITRICDALDIPVSVLMLHCITEDDVSPERRDAFRMLINPIKEFLK